MLLHKIITYFLSLIAIVSLSVILSLQPGFVILEYNRDSFPQDSYGLSILDRTQLGVSSLAFLTTWQTSAKASGMLSDLTFPQTTKAVYTSAEISHLKDVKHYIDLMRFLLIITLTILISILLASIRLPSKLTAVLTSIRAASISIIALMSIIGIAVAFFWQPFFLFFHQLLFPQGNWTFSRTSSLIRLFPEIFWVDYAIFLIGIVLTLSLISILLTTYFIQLKSSKN
jgi:integral membrane protein (TIGR01906 family)